MAVDGEPAGGRAANLRGGCRGTAPIHPGKRRARAPRGALLVPIYVTGCSSVCYKPLNHTSMITPRRGSLKRAACSWHAAAGRATSPSSTSVPQQSRLWRRRPAVADVDTHETLRPCFLAGRSRRTDSKSLAGWPDGFAAPRGVRRAAGFGGHDRAVVVPTRDSRDRSITLIVCCSQVWVSLVLTRER